MSPEESLNTSFNTEQESKIDDGFGVYIKQKTLYHGSATENINKFSSAENDTIGSGVYLTSREEDAQGYAKRRSKSSQNTHPIVYTASIENMKFVDLRESQNIERVFNGFKDVLQQKLKEPQLSWYFRGALEKAISSIDSEESKKGNIKAVTFSTGKLFSDYVASLGYDGVIALEGGEGEEIQNHDSYVVFDPAKIHVQGERKI